MAEIAEKVGYEPKRFQTLFLPYFADGKVYAIHQ
jgi:hypothetical protein